jgi:hypothetical protein
VEGGPKGRERERELAISHQAVLELGLIESGDGPHGGLCVPEEDSFKLDQIPEVGLE